MKRLVILFNYQLTIELLLSAIKSLLVLVQLLMKSNTLLSYRSADGLFDRIARALLCFSKKESKKTVDTEVTRLLNKAYKQKIS